MSDLQQQRLVNKIQTEFGKEVIEALFDDSVIEIMLNSDGTLWIERIGEPMQEIVNHNCRPQAAIHTIASMLNTSVSTENPILECELPIDGSRFEALVPPTVKNPSFTIRKKAKQIFTLNDYIKANIITPRQKELIDEAIIEKKNILIAGGTGSGKTTLTNAIIDRMSELTPDDRIVIIEDTAEIQCKSKNNVIFRATIHADMVKLLKATMRFRPDRILVGEVRGGEALTLLKSWNTGHPGGIATVHANSALSALTRIEQLVAEVSTTVSKSVIAEAINMVIFIKKTPKGRVVKEMISIEGFKTNYITKEIK